MQCSSCGSPEKPFYDRCIGECLHISDFQAGLLTGPAFSLTALFLVIPCGYFADRLSRVLLLWVTSLSLSLMRVHTCTHTCLHSYTHSQMHLPTYF